MRDGVAHCATVGIGGGQRFGRAERERRQRRRWQRLGFGVRLAVSGRQRLAVGRLERLGGWRGRQRVGAANRERGRR